MLEGLNEEQKKAVCCTEGPVLIVAGAGSGKTRVLTSRLAHLLEGGVAPESILALTFTKKAATEMKERVAVMVGARKARAVVMGTFHSVFVRFLREYAESLGYPSQFTIYDTADSTSAMKTCIKELGLDDKVYKARDVLSRISGAKNNLITVSAYRSNPQLLAADAHAKRARLVDLYELYQQKLRQNGVMDFDDILVNMNILLRDNRDALLSLCDRFSHIMVDEYQDTNYSQYLILKKLAQFHHNICVVGDDSQSIYAFRGAKIENILNFKKDYPESKVFRLERNYRSTPNIVNAANSLIAKNNGRIPKECYAVGDDGDKLHVLKTFTEAEEATMIVSEILSRMRCYKAKYRDFAILYRTNAQSRALEEQLRRRNIPYMIYSGNSFFDRAEVKDMMAYFKLAVNLNDDESFKRIVNKPARAIGDTTVNALAAAALKAGTTLFRAAWLEGLEAEGLRPAAVKKLREFCSMVAGFNARIETTDAFGLAKAIADESGLYAFYKADTSIEGQARTANVEELVSSVQGFVEERLEDNFGDEGHSDYTVTLADFLENVSLLSNVDVTDEEDDGNKVALMTVHSSKGLEFPHVFIAGLEENLFPSMSMLTSASDIEEERRLCYVAITRAMKTVTLSFAATRMRNGKHESNPPSRFIAEIDRKYFDNPLDPEDFSTEGVRHELGGFGSRFSGGRLDRPGYSRPSPADYGRSSRPVGLPARPPLPGDPRDIARPSAPVGGRPSAPALHNADFTGVPMTELREGMRVEHNRFGEGVIKSLSGRPPETKAVIMFDEFGEKLLLLKYAKIRPVK